MGGGGLFVLSGWDVVDTVVVFRGRRHRKGFDSKGRSESSCFIETLGLFTKGTTTLKRVNVLVYELSSLFL